MKYAFYTIAVVAALSLAACTTPKTIMVSDAGEQITCGGNTSASIIFGYIGYNVQKLRDNACVSDYARQGYRVENVAAEESEVYKK